MNNTPLTEFLNSDARKEITQSIATDFDLEFRLGEPLIVGTDFSYVEEAVESDESEQEEDLLSSWNHRAMLGDENRQIYNDGMHTDWNALEEQEHLSRELDHEENQRD